VTTTEPAPRVKQGLPPSALTLIAVNAIPLLGVLGSHWTVLSVILLYWCENVVIGAFNVLRMAAASPRNITADLGKLFLIPFFVLHYGMFTAVHGVFVMALFGPRANFSASPAAFASAVRGAGIGLAVVAIAASHAFSFVHNYLMSGEYRNASPQLLMAQPYARVVVLHVVILFGGIGATAMGSPTFALVLLIALKTGLDLRAHLAERRKLGTVTEA
jgi:hypothetical protein